MKNLLMFSYEFPPCQNIAGSLRSEGFVNNLAKLGWRSHVICLKQTQDLGVEKYRHIRRIASLLPLTKPFNLSPYGWIFTAFIAGIRAKRNIHFDAVYVTCPPFPLALIGLLFKFFSNHAPVILDFRDAWSIGPYRGSTRNSKLSGISILESVILSNIDHLIVNSPSAHRAYLENYNFLKNKITLIPNGYNEDNFSSYNPESRRSDRMTLLYLGSFGVSGRQPDLILRAIKEFTEQGYDINLKIIGDKSLLTQDKIREFQLDNYVSAYAPVSHSAAIESMSYCDALLLYQEPSQSLATPVAGKTYEYLRSGKPILAIAPPGDNLAIVERYAGRCEIINDFDSTKLLQSLHKLYSEWKDNVLQHTPPKSEFLETFERFRLAESLAGILNELT